MPLSTTEEQVIAHYVDSDNDQWLKQAIAKHCAQTNHLKHITEDYLDRISKLQLFL
jgi:hypothetical protein